MRCAIEQCPEPAVSSGWCDFHAEWSASEFERRVQGFEASPEYSKALEREALEDAARRERLAEAVAQHHDAADRAMASVISGSGAVDGVKVLEIRCGAMARKGRGSGRCGKPLFVVVKSDAGRLLVDLRSRPPRAVFLLDWTWPAGVPSGDAMDLIGLNDERSRCAAGHRRDLQWSMAMAAIGRQQERIVI